MPTTTSRYTDDALWDLLASGKGVWIHDPNLAADPRLETWCLNGWINAYGTRWRTVLARRPWNNPVKEQP